jgi:hypothetical protein
MNEHRKRFFHIFGLNFKRFISNTTHIHDFTECVLKKITYLLATEGCGLEMIRCGASFTLKNSGSHSIIAFFRAALG